MYQLIPRHYGLTVRGKTKTMFPPSSFALAVIGLMPKKEIERLLKDEVDFSELEKNVKKRHGSYNFIRKESFKSGNCKTTEITAEIKSRSDGRKSNINNYRKVHIRHPFLEDIVENGTIVSCQCEENLYKKYDISVCCIHAAETLLELSKEAINEFRKINFSGKLKTPFLPYDLEFEDVIEILKIRYLQKGWYATKYFDFDVKHTKLKNDVLKLMYKNPNVFTFEVLPHDEKGIKYLQFAEAPLINLDFKKDAYLIERFGGNPEFSIRYVKQNIDIRILIERMPVQYLVQAEVDKNFENDFNVKMYYGKDPLTLGKRKFLFVKNVAKLRNIVNNLEKNINS